MKVYLVMCIEGMYEPSVTPVKAYARLEQAEQSIEKLKAIDARYNELIGPAWRAFRKWWDNNPDQLNEQKQEAAKEKSRLILEELGATPEEIEWFSHPIWTNSRHDCDYSIEDLEVELD